MSIRRWVVALILPLAAAGAGAGLVQAWWSSQTDKGASPTTASTGWYCPMHPEVVSKEPGSCPICGMNLVKSKSGESISHDDQFHVSAETQARMGVVLEEAVETEFHPTWMVPAQIVADERRAVTLSPKVDGWIKKLGVSVVGQPVRKGQMLYEIYSPELQQRQRDYLDLLARRDALASKAGSMGATVGNQVPDLMMSSVARERYRSRTRLAAADVPEAVIDDLERSRRVRDVVSVLAEHDGIVTSIGAREGAYVTPAQFIVGYADLKATWAELSFTPDQLALLGEHAQVTLKGFDADRLTRAVKFQSTNAVIDPSSRTARVRVPVQGATARILPGTLLTGEVMTAARKAITVKRDAVLQSGSGAFVIVSDDANHFRQVPVKLGEESTDLVEVVKGLKAGQKVAMNGQFLLGAEASLQATRHRHQNATPMPEGETPADSTGASPAHAHRHAR